MCWWEICRSTSASRDVSTAEHARVELELEQLEWALRKSGLRTAIKMAFPCLPADRRQGLEQLAGTMFPPLIGSI